MVEAFIGLVALAIGCVGGLLVARAIASGKSDVIGSQLSTVSQERDTLRQDLQAAVVAEAKAIAEREAAVASAERAEANAQSASGRSEGLAEDLAEAQQQIASLLANVGVLQEQVKAKEQELERQRLGLRSRASIYSRCLPIQPTGSLKSGPTNLGSKAKHRLNPFCLHFGSSLASFGNEWTPYITKTRRRGPR